MMKPKGPYTVRKMQNGDTKFVYKTTGKPARYVGPTFNARFKADAIIVCGLMNYAWLAGMDAAKKDQ